MGSSVGYQAVVKLTVQVVVTLTLLGTSAYIILSGAYDESYAKWAFGMAGAVFGYWAR
jgi:hypothetical protein